MSEAKYIPEEILASIQKLPEESWEELANFIEYLQFKNYSNYDQDNINFSISKSSAEESEQIIKEILAEAGDSIPSLSDYAVSRDSIYQDHL